MPPVDDTVDVDRLNKLSGKVVDACIEVHQVLGPGLLESAYEACLARELAYRGMCFSRQRPVPILYRDEEVDCAFRIDLLVEDSIIVELKATDRIHPIHVAQILTYLKLTGLHLGLIVNFNTTPLKHGIKRVVRDLPSPPAVSAVSAVKPVPGCEGGSAA